MSWTHRPWAWLLAVLNLGLFVALIAQAGLDDDFLSGAALAAGGLAYSLMATNLLLAIRLPVLEHMFGPIDRLYVAHRIIGTAIVAVIGLHLTLIPIASLVDRQEGLLDSPSPAIPLGVLGALVIFGSVALALNPKIPYHRWQPFHMAVAGGFVLLTIHFVVGGSEWISLASPGGVLLFVFMVIGLLSMVLRLVGRGRGGLRYRIISVTPRERAVEVVMAPVSRSLNPHRPGQFIFLTAKPGGQRETHPFSLTSRSSGSEVSVLIRPSGDWTELVQTGLEIGDEVALSGPFGGFTPSASDGAPAFQVWVAAGAGITPFLSVLRTARADKVKPGMSTSVELVYIARNPKDAPCWYEITELERQLPWLRIHPWFSEETGRPSPEKIRELVEDLPSESVWYLCGPKHVSAMFTKEIRSATGAVIHREAYQWRAGVSTRPGKPTGVR